MLAAVFVRFLVSSEVYEPRVTPADLAATQAALDDFLTALAFAVDHISAIHAYLKPGFPTIHLHTLPVKQG